MRYITGIIVIFGYNFILSYIEYKIRERNLIKTNLVFLYQQLMDDLFYLILLVVLLLVCQLLDQVLYHPHHLEHLQDHLVFQHYHHRFFGLAFLK